MNSKVSEQTVETLEVVREIEIAASIDIVFETVLENMGPLNEAPDKTPHNLTLEAWPGGRWYRDLGGDNGHFWGHVQAIKRPTLVEICGPLFASSPFVSNVQYRLTEKDGGTVIHFRHTAIGNLADDHKKGVVNGWGSLLERIRIGAEKKHVG